MNALGARIPPNNLRAEEALLGAMLLSVDAIDAAVTSVRAGDFYRPAHGHVFAAIVALWNVNEPVDAVTVAEELKRTGLLDKIGGQAVLLDVQAATPAISNAAAYAKIVAENAQLRRWIKTCTEALDIAYGIPADVPGALDQFESKVFNLVHSGTAGNSSGMTLDEIGDLLPDFLLELEERCRQADAGSPIGGLPTGLTDLDAKLGGLIPGGVYVVGALPGEGKTSLALDIACHAASLGKPTIGFSLEMTRTEMLGRFVASRGGIPSDAVRHGQMTDEDWVKARRLAIDARNWPITVLSARGLSPLDIRAQVRRYKAKHKGELGLVFVDYIQLLELAERAENRQNEVAKLSGHMKSIAIEFNVPIIVNAQLSRSATASPDYRPKKSDLKDSGALEADADAVMLIYREELHNDASDRKGIAEIIVDKNRQGQRGKVELAYLSRYTTFRDLDHRPRGAEAAALAAASAGHDGGMPYGAADIEPF